MSDAAPFVFKCATFFLFVYNTMTLNDYIQHKKRYDLYKLDALKGHDAELKRITKALETLNNTKQLK